MPALLRRQLAAEATLRTFLAAKEIAPQAHVDDRGYGVKLVLLIGIKPELHRSRSTFRGNSPELQAERVKYAEHGGQLRIPVG